LIHLAEKKFRYLSDEATTICYTGCWPQGLYKTEIESTDFITAFAFLKAFLVIRNKNKPIIIIIIKVKLSLCLINQALHHEGVWGSGCIDPRFLDLGTSWR
jgi:hypothetical protein